MTGWLKAIRSGRCLFGAGPAGIVGWSFRWLALYLLFAAVAPLRAQSFDFDKDRQTVASLDGLWHFHPSDDERWANPDFDDSAWPLLQSNLFLVCSGISGLSGYAWYRFTLGVPAGAPPISLLLPAVTTGYTLYVDGRCAGNDGTLAPNLFIRHTSFSALWRR